MLIKPIARAEGTYLNEKLIIDTTYLFQSYYETMVMFEDGEEIDSHRFDDFGDAITKHMELVKFWNDKIYNGSTAKLLGVENKGQFMKEI